MHKAFSDPLTRRWFAERMNESTNGRVRVPTRLVNKYREMTSDYETPAAIVRQRLINTCYNEEYVGCPWLPALLTSANHLVHVTQSLTTNTLLGVAGALR